VPVHAYNNSLCFGLKNKYFRGSYQIIFFLIIENTADKRRIGSREVKKNSWLPTSFLMSCGHFVDDLYPGILPPLIPLLMVNFDFSITFAGVLASLASFANSFMQPLFGYLSDRIDRRTFVIFGPLISAVFYCCIGFMPNKWLLLLCVLLGGAGVAMFHPQAAKMTHQVSSHNRGKAMSVFTTGGTIGYPVGALVVTSVIVPLWGLKAAPIMIIPVFVLMYFMVRHAPAQHKSTAPNGLSDMFPSVAQALAMGVFVGINILRAVVVMGFNLLIPIWYAQQNMSLQYGGYAIFIFHTMGGLGGLIGGFMSDRYSSRRIILISFIGGAMFFVLFTHAAGLAALGFLGLAGFSIFLSIPPVINLAQATMPVHRGTAASMVMGFSWGVGGLLILIVSRIADVYGVAGTMQVLAYFPLLAVFLGIMVRRRKFSENV